MRRGFRCEGLEKIDGRVNVWLVENQVKVVLMQSGLHKVSLERRCFQKENSSGQPQLLSFKIKNHRDRNGDFTGDNQAGRSAVAKSRVVLRLVVTRNYTQTRLSRGCYRNESSPVTQLRNKMDNFEEENHMLRVQVTTMQKEIEKLTSMVASLMATQNQAIASVSQSSSTFVPPPVSSAPSSTPQYVMPEGYPWGMPVGFLGEESRLMVSEIPHVQSTVPIPQLVNTLPQVTATVSAPLVHTTQQTQMPIFHAESVGGYDRMDDLQIKYDEMQKEMRALRGKDLFGQDAHKLCLVPDVVVPHKFKVPDFEKYKGSTCPKAHLIMYARKMSTQSSNDKLLIHYFQDSLTGAALRWYMDLDRANVSSFNDLASAFIRQYNYNSYLAPDRDELRALTQKERESFKEYAQRWRELAAQIRPPGGPHLKNPAYPHIAAIALPPQYPQSHHLPSPQQSFNHNRAQTNQPLYPIPVKYVDLLPALLAKNFVQTRPPPPVPTVLPPWYRSDLTCAFHQGAPGHDVERCYPLKKAVQDLIRNNMLSFKDENPNVQGSSSA
ncbi:hypothetical protein TSUD_385300 [Trifolium subterraneum]|uniref:Retrotransposon gag domain-containing protein n=1 Tax=Trifolium subterraneum TaxID=3900 RepID=A0A2Z6NF74_TRISU|nr:hypothetical protein TSUD_385300 [Trifolium subterraneum]